MKVRFFLFENYHGKQNIGSSYIRGHQLVKIWDEAEVYKYGENPDVLIFQKVYMTPDYKFHSHFKNKKILDICDPDWLNGTTLIRETIDNVDAVTCSSEALVSFLKQFTNKPVVLIKDRFNTSVIPKPKLHTGDAKTVVWFGYRHNAETLKPALNKIIEKNLKLLIISDDDPLAWQWNPKNFNEEKYQFIKYNEETIYTDLQKADYAILPDGTRPIDTFKSNNRAVKAILAGLPVVKTIEDMEKYRKADNRNIFVHENWQKYIDEYDINKSVQEYKDLINKL